MKNINYVIYIYIYINIIFQQLCISISEGRKAMVDRGQAAECKEHRELASERAEPHGRALLSERSK